MLKTFGLKFIDIMLGIILGLGFQWWPDLVHAWQIIAFVFIYLNLVDYWIDYSPTLKKFPLAGQFDVITHTFLIFGMFFMVYTTQKSVPVFLLSFVFFRLIDIIWLWRIEKVHKPAPHDERFIKTWIRQDFYEILSCIVLIILSILTKASPLLIILVFIGARVGLRAFSSVSYKKLYFSAD